MNLIPPVRAELAERFIFNFRMPLAAMAELLPAPWLTPLPVRGWGVASFCLLDLRHITAAPLPTVAGINSISCAPRFAVLDHSDGTPRPAVFVETRQTSSPFGAWFTSLGFSCRHPFADAQITHAPSSVRLLPKALPATAHRAIRASSRAWICTRKTTDTRRWTCWRWKARC